MELNAYEKVKQTLMDACGELPYEPLDLFDEANEKAKQWLLETGYGTRIERFQEEHPNSKWIGIDYSFENGLDFYFIEASYTNKKGNSCVRREMVLTENKKRLACVSFDSEKEFYASVLQDSEGNANFPSEEKLVEFTDTTIYLKDHYCGTTFTAYNNLTDCTLLQETFLQQDLALETDAYEESNIVPDLFFHDAELTIFYQNMQPIRAQLSHPFEIEDRGYNPTSSKDLFRIEKMLNQELEEVLKQLKATVEDYNKENQEFKKTLGTLKED